MNYSTAVFLINDRARAVLGHYEADTPTTKAPRTLFKTFDTTVKKGDLVLVPTNTRHNIAVVKVDECDVDFDIESASPTWIIGKLPPISAYETLLEQEQEAIRTIQSAEKNRKREELRKALLADTEAKIGALPIAAIGHDAEITEQP